MQPRSLQRSSPKAKVTIRMPRSANLLWSAEPRLAGLKGSTVMAFAGGCPMLGRYCIAIHGFLLLCDLPFRRED